MSAVVDAIGDVVDVVGDVIDFVGDVGQDIIDVAGDALSAAGRAIETTVRAALDDPLGTLATIATAVYAPYLLPVVSAGRVVANGGDLEDALKAAAISYAAQGVGSFVGNQVGTALTYGTDIGSAQTAMLAAQSGDMLGGTWGGTLGNLAGSAASGATAGILTGGDPIEMALNALGTAGVRLGTDYAMNAAGQLIDKAGNLVADTSSAAEIPNTAVEGQFGYGYRYFDDGTVIDPFGNYFKDNQLIWSPRVSEIENIAQPGEETYGWRFFSDGTSMSPRGEYYDNQGQMVWSPYKTEEVTSLTEGAKEITNPAQEGDVGYGWKYYSNGVSISPEGEYFKDNEIIWSPFEDATAGQYTPGTYEIPNPAKEGDEGYGWRYFTDGTTIDPYGRYYDAEGNITYAPSADNTSNLFDPKLVEGAKDYFTRMFKGQLSRELTGSFSKLLFGSPRGQEALMAARQAGKAPTFENLSALGFGDLFVPREGDEDMGQEDVLDVATSSRPASLFEGTDDAEWAPQTKLENIGPSAKYVNLDSDKFYLGRDQQQRAKSREALRPFGWLTPDEEKLLLAEEEMKDEQESPFFEIDEPSYAMAPWMTEQPTFAAKGGLIEHNPEFYSEGGASLANRYVKGDGDGTSDSVPAMLASGEFVIPADVVSGLGNGDNDAGAKVLDKFMVAVRKHKRGADPRELPPDSKGPLTYLSEALK